MQHLVVVDGAPDEFEFPSRLTFEVQNPGPLRIHADETAHGIIGGVLFIRKRRYGGLHISRSGGSGVERKNLALLGAVASNGHVGGGEQPVPVLQREMNLLSCVTVFMEADYGADARFGERPCGELHVVDFDIVRELFAAKSDGVNGDTLAANFVQGLEIDAAGIICSIAQQDHRAYGKTRGFRNHFPERVAEMSGRGRGGQLFRILDSIERASSAIEADLEPLLKIGKHAAAQRAHDPVLSRSAVIGDGHAARIVHYDCDDVLLRLQRRDAERGLPQHDEQKSDDCRLQTPR